MINKGTKNFIEIGPGKVLSGLIKRIEKNTNVKSVNNENDIKELINYSKAVIENIFLSSLLYKG